MITEYDDFVTWMYVLIDDIWQRISPLYHRLGSQPECSNSDLLKMAIVGECRESDKETNSDLACTLSLQSQAAQLNGCNQPHPPNRAHHA